MKKILSLLFAITLFGTLQSCSKEETEDLESKFTLCDKTRYRKLYGSLYQYYCEATVYECDANGETIRKRDFDVSGTPESYVAHKDAVKLIIKIYSKVVLQQQSVELANYWMSEVFELKKGETIDIVYDNNTVFSMNRPE